MIDDIAEAILDGLSAKAWLVVLVVVIIVLVVVYA